MYLTEHLLTEWTGLNGDDLLHFYLEYKKHTLTHVSSFSETVDLEHIRNDIMKFKHDIYDKQTVKQLIQLWESRVHSN